MARNGADILIETLIAFGVDTIYGMPGDGINGIMEAIRTHGDKVRFIQVRHEESAAFAAVVVSRVVLLVARLQGRTRLAVVLGLWFWYRRSSAGVRVQAMVGNPVLAQAVGIDTRRLASRTFVVGVVLAGLAIALWHSGLYAGLIPESVSPCTKDGPSCSDRGQMAILGLPIPYLSLGAFTATALCLIFMKGKRS